MGPDEAAAAGDEEEGHVRCPRSEPPQAYRIVS
jgi:hypothetical protein